MAIITTTNKISMLTLKEKPGETILRLIYKYFTRILKLYRIETAENNKAFI
jgi:hypothetical protein